MHNDANANRTYFDLDEGYVETLGSGVTAEIISMPNGWYRCVATFTYSLSPTSTNIGWYLGDTDNSTTVTDSGGVYVYGAQFEAGSYATSLIHTSGSTVTRSQDAATNAGNSDLISSTEGVLYGQLSKPQLDNDAHLLIALINNSVTNDQNTVTIGFDEDDDFYVRIKANGNNELIYISQKSFPNQFYKIALKI